MFLIRPTKKYEKSWREGLLEFSSKGEGFGAAATEEDFNDLEGYIKRDCEHSQGKNLKAGYVPATTYWLMDDEKFVGHVNIRHELTAKLKEVGGHIEYAIRPSQRKKGYGRAILKYACEKARDAGLTQVLITCDEHNVGSYKIIEANGGVLEKKIIVGNVVRRHYLINLS